MGSGKLKSELKKTKVGQAAIRLKRMATSSDFAQMAGELARGRLGNAGFRFNRLVTNKALREAFTALKRMRLGKTELKRGASAFLDEGHSAGHVDRLNRDGFTILDRKLSPGTIESIVRFSEGIGCYDMYRSERIDPKNPPTETHVAEFKRSELVRFAPILDIANDPGLLEIAQGFLGARPTISNINMWWSFGGRKQPKHAQLFHRDIDDWKFCKLFIYLTDVTADSGPHVYVRKSSNSPAFRKPRRYSDEEIEKEFGKENVLKFIDTKGAAFIVDTYGFHKGLLPVTGDRLLLQVQYSLDPIGLEEYSPVKLDAAGHDPYINRLLYHV